jgi:hypothetical protein
MVVIVLTIFVCGWFYLRDSCAGILEQPMGAKNRLRHRIVVPAPKGGGHTRLRVRGWGSPNSDEGTYTYTYFVQYTNCLTKKLGKKQKGEKLIIHSYAK